MTQGSAWKNPPPSGSRGVTTSVKELDPKGTTSDAWSPCTGSVRLLVSSRLRKRFERPR